MDTEEPLTIGDDLREFGNEGTRGIIDEAAVFNHALTQDEVQRAMDDGVLPFLSVSAKGKLATIWADIKVRE